ncbi:MAG: hypothetical protein ACK4GO_12630 [Gemmobacter sp.]
MKYGVLTFSYASPDRPEDKSAALLRVGVNLGDYVQTLAVRHLYASFGIDEANILPVDRDTLPAYSGPPVILPMNACFFERCFPLPPQVRPVFLGFQAKPAVVARHADVLRRYQPIGCRDHATAAACHAAGIEADVTGCLSLTFPRRTEPPTRPCVLIVHGFGAGAFPAEVLRLMPRPMLRTAEFVYQRQPVARLPLGPSERADMQAMAARLLADYRDRATLVVTPLHHAAAPCIGMGVPVVLCRRTPDPRFSVLSTLLTLHLPPFDTPIDWGQAPANATRHADRLIEWLRKGLRAMH